MSLLEKEINIDRLNFTFNSDNSPSKLKNLAAVSPTNKFI